MEFDKKLSAITGLLGLVVAIIALVPAFLSLGEGRPKVYFAVSSSAIQIPDGMDTANVLKILSASQIPHGRLHIGIVNTGEGPASQIKLRLVVGTPKAEYKTNPSFEDEPAWVEIGARQISPDPNGTTITQTFKNLAVGKIIGADVWFEYKAPGRSPSIDTVLKDLQVYYDGKEARQVADISKAPRVTPLSHFRVPGVIFAVAFGLTVCVALVAKLGEDPVFRRTFFEVSLGSLGVLVPAIYEAVSDLRTLIGREPKADLSPGAKHPRRRKQSAGKPKDNDDTSTCEVQRHIDQEG